MPTILEALVPASSLLHAGAGIVPVGGAKDAIPDAAWRLEAGNVAESDATFGAVVAAPKSLAFMFKVSRELLMDATNMQDALTTACAQAMPKPLDRAGLRGTGTNPEPRGIKNTSGINAVTNCTNGAALASYANFIAPCRQSQNRTRRRRSRHHEPALAHDARGPGGHQEPAAAQA